MLNQSVEINSDKWLQLLNSNYKPNHWMWYTMLYSKATRSTAAKDNIFPCPDFWFLIFFLDFFKYLESLKKNKTALKLQTRRRWVSKWENKLVPSSVTYLCSMQGYMCRIATLGGKSPLGKNGESSCKRYIKWLWMARHETSSGYMADNQIQGSRQRLNMASKAYDNAITTWHKGVLGTKARKNIKRSMRLLHKDMETL